jgi:glutamate 5-kinase
MRLVIKVGTQVIAGKTGLSKARIKQIVGEMALLSKRGHEIILVASGAVRAGMPKLPLLNSPLKKKIWASIGQPILMKSYEDAFERLNFKIGQVMILRNNFTSHEGYGNLVSLLEVFLQAKIIPVLNENDPTKTKDLTLGDNDILSAMVAVAVSADKLIILTDQDGLYSGNPSKNPDAVLIKTVSDIDFEIEKLCGKEKSSVGLGGMLSKVRATKHAVNSGTEVLICNGTKKGRLLATLGKDFYGTRFVPKIKMQMSDKKRWMMSAKGAGIMTIDDGAAKALHSGKSLLLPGVVAIKGDFKRGEIVEIVSKSGLAVAYGKVNFPAREIQIALATQRQSQEKGLRILGREVIHRNYMVLLSKTSI